jgi:hypothetical protein
MNRAMEAMGGRVLKRFRTTPTLTVNGVPREAASRETSARSSSA